VKRMKKVLLWVAWSGMCLSGWMGSPVWAKKETHTSKKTSYHHKTSHKKPSHKKTSHKKNSQKASHSKKAGTKKSSHGLYYVTPDEENLRSTPNGRKIGILFRGAAVKVQERKGKWALVTVKAWIWQPSLSKTPPKVKSELLVEEVEGAFVKHGFVIRGKLDNQSKALFHKVVLQGELFKGKKRVAYKTLKLFSARKPLQPGHTFSFSIPFKRTTGFDSYSVRILSASHP